MALPIEAATGVYRIKINENGEYLQLHSTQSKKTVISAPLDYSDTAQLWNVVAVYADTYRISSFDGDLALTIPDSGDPNLILQFGGSTTWKVESDESSSILTPAEQDIGEILARIDLYKKNFPDVSSIIENILNKRCRPIFELIEERAPDSQFQRTYFKLTPKQALEQGPYDIIIIGAGYGGGVLGADLFDTNHKVGDGAKKILLLERGQLVFHSHCLNSARPTGNRTGRDQFNHTFYNRFKSNYNVAKESLGDWGGGPVYGVGGRSSIWSLASPRAHDRTLHENFPKEIVDDLLYHYYTKAERLLSLFLPRTRPEHRELLDRLTLSSPGNLDVAWQWARIASEFREDRNFDFGRGAFSSIDHLVEIAMNKPVDKDGNFVEHKNFKILLGAEAREILWHPTLQAEPEPRAVRVKTNQGIIDFPLNHGGRVVLSAGSVHSPAILLRSGVDLERMGGLHITDHNILVHNASYRYREPSDRGRVGSLKLRSFLNLPGTPKGGNNMTDLTLASLYIDSSPFLYRGAVNIASNDVPSLVTTFMMRTPLEKTERNKITLDPKTKDPIVKIGRSTFEKQYYPEKVAAMMAFNENAKRVMENVLNVEFVPQLVPQTIEPYFKPLKLGGGGHEMGTIPIGSCLDNNQKLVGYTGVYVADNSIFPYVPEANPSLTLTALTIRLSRHLLSRKPVRVSENTVAVVNHSGDWIKVSVSRTIINKQIIVDSPQEFNPGRYQVYSRDAAQETAYVYKLDLAQDQSKGRVYLATPEFHIIENGKFVAIL